MPDDNWIHFSYRDVTQEAQHASIPKDQAGAYIGKLLTHLCIYERHLKALDEARKEMER